MIFTLTRSLLGYDIFVLGNPPKTSSFQLPNAQNSIKGSKDLDSSLVSNGNFSEILCSSGWALDQVA